jgi:putative ABC transport system permease protein
MLSDLRDAVRLLRRAPGFTVAAILALALRLSTTTSIFAVAYGVLLRPLAISRADSPSRPENAAFIEAHTSAGGGR